MPYIGLPSFLLVSSDSDGNEEIIVSMPYIGLPSFLHRKKHKEDSYSPYCVNALHRASLISTPDSKFL